MTSQQISAFAAICERAANHINKATEALIRASWYHVGHSDWCRWCSRSISENEAHRKLPSWYTPMGRTESCVHIACHEAMRTSERRP